MALLCTFKRVKFLYESCIAFVKKENAAKKARRLHIPLLLFLLYLQTRWKTRAPGFPNCLLVPTLCDTSQHQRVDKSIEKQVLKQDSRLTAATLSKPTIIFHSS